MSDSCSVDSHSDVKSRWVVNLSSKELTDFQHAALEKGLNYAFTPKSVPATPYIVAAEQAIDRLRVPKDKADAIRSRVTQILQCKIKPESNLSRQEWLGLQDIKKDQSIMVLGADKGRATVLLDRADYVYKARTLLQDNKTYNKLMKDPTDKIKRKVVEVLSKIRSSGNMSNDPYYNLYPQLRIPKFYGLPKIHKEGTPLRPIVDSINSVTYQISKKLATILSPLVGKEFHIRNSQDFVDKLNHITIDDNEIMVSYDVKALFTSVPVHEVVHMIKSLLSRDRTLVERTTVSVDNICDLLSLVLTNTYFSFNGNFYEQKFGTAMGSPVSPIVANIFMQDLETKAVQYSEFIPKVWYRYVDDTFVIIEKEHEDYFFEHFNLINPSIQFTKEIESNCQLPFLDVLVLRDSSGYLNTSVYRKPTHTNQYLNFGSNHPLPTHIGVARTLFDRASNIVKDQDQLQKEKQHIKTSLKHCGYKSWAFNRAIRPRSSNRPIETMTNPIEVSYLSLIYKAFQNPLKD